jgi:hypothetical protein
VVENAKMLCPQGQIGPITEEERKKAIKESGLEKSYRETEDRRSAYEILIDDAKKQEEQKSKEIAAKEEESKKKQKEKEDEKAQKASKKRNKAIWKWIVTNILKPLGKALVRSITKKR